VSFSQSTFTLDIDGKPTLVLRTKWRVNAEDYCRNWVQAHRDELPTKGPYGSDLPLISRPAITLRMARAVEKAVYEASADSAQLFDDVSVFILTDVGHCNRPSDGELTNDPEQTAGDADPQSS
jgi:hypothetical protein